MNIDYIMAQIKPKLVNNSFLSYTDFYKLFGSFHMSKEELNEIQLLIQKEGIEFTYPDILDEQIDEDIEGTSDFDDLEVFRDNNSSTIVSSNKQIKQSNEILCKLIKSGNDYAKNQAKNDLCIKNHGFIMKCASKYEKFYRNKLSIDDLEQVGYVGLLKAAERYDPSLNAKFITYASFWIKQAMLREIFDNGFTIRLPVHIMEKISRIVRLDNKYELQGLSFNERVRAISDDYQIPEEKVLEYLTLNLRFRNCASLNAPVGEDKEIELEEFIEDTVDLSVEDKALQNIFSERIKKVIGTLSEREEKVIIYRFGLMDGRERTLEEVGQILGVTRERVRQIEAKAFRKLKHPSRSKYLKDFKK